MHPRLLHFFETSVVRIILQNLARLQGTVSQDSTLVTNRMNGVSNFSLHNTDTIYN